VVPEPSGAFLILLAFQVVADWHGETFDLPSGEEILSAGSEKYIAVNQMMGDILCFLKRGNNQRESST
jgi:hypothetical protein